MYENQIRVCDRCGHDMNPNKTVWLTEINEKAPNIIELDHNRGTYCSEACAENDYHDLFSGKNLSMYTRSMGKVSNKKLDSNWYDN